MPDDSVILSPNKTNGRIRPIRLVVFHTMEVDESGPNVAEAVARSFQAPARRASTHKCIDTDSTVRCVADKDTAWAAPGANADGLQMELAGRAGQNMAEWDDADSDAILERAAQAGAEWAVAHGLPIKHLSVAELLAGESGFVGHIDVTNAYHQSTHWDPGPAFPWDTVLARIAALVGGATPVDHPIPVLVSSGHRTLKLGSVDHEVGDLQTFLGIAADNVFGPITLAAVKAYQNGVGLTPDGIVGAQTWAKIDANVRPTPAPTPVQHRNATLVRGTQLAVHANPDTFWGNDTERRVNLVRAALNGQFPEGVAVTQGVVGTKTDGLWGPNSRASLHSTVAELQRAWGCSPDGIWGADTEAHWVAARAGNFGIIA